MPEADRRVLLLAMGAFDELKIAPGLPKAERINKLAATAGKVFDAAGVSVWHPKLDPANIPFKVFCFPPTAERKYAIYMTLGASELHGRELLCFTQSAPKDPANDQWAWLLGATGIYAPGGAKVSVMDTIPVAPGILKESAHEFVALAPPAFLPPQLLKDYSALFGAELVMIVPITKNERAFAVQKGTPLLFTKMIAQSIEPYADRKPGQTSL